WRRKKYGRRPRERERFLEDVHAPPNQHDQLFNGTAVSAGNSVRRGRRRQRDNVMEGHAPSCPNILALMAQRPPNSDYRAVVSASSSSTFVAPSMFMMQRCNFLH